MLRKTVVAAALAVLLAACSGGKTYQVSSDDARKILLDTRPPLDSLGLGFLDSMVTQPSKNQVRWTLKGPEGEILMHYIATIDDGGEGKSTVSLEVTPPLDNRNSTMGRKMEENPAIVELLEVAMEEQIASRLERREYNMAAVQPYILKAAIVSAPNLHKEAMGASSELQREASERADDYRREQEYRDIQREINRDFDSESSSN